MHVGQISFCDRIAYNIKSSDTKDEILNNILNKFDIQILQKHWHRLDEDGISHLYRTPHFICLRSNGNPYYMYFTLYEDVPIIYYVDKKIQPGYQKPRIILGKGKWNETLFKGTIIEGEMVKDNYNKWVFLINDVIAWKGEYFDKKTLPQRIEYAYELLDKNYTIDTFMDMCKFQVKKYAYATQEGIKSLLELKDKLPYTSRGIYFCPFVRRFKPKLYNFDETLIKTVIRKVKDCPEFRENSISTKESSPTRDISKVKTIQPTQNLTDKTDIIQNTSNVDHVKIPDTIKNATEGTKEVLWLRKTEYPDVYDIYTTNNGMIHNTKIGIANVPTLKVSKMLRAEFKDKTVAIYIPFMCVYSEKFNKWEPLVVHTS